MKEMTDKILDVVNECINSKDNKENDITSNIEYIGEVTEIKPTQLDENLVELGVDSITFIRIIVELEELFEIEIPDEKLLITEISTIRKMVEVVTATIDITKA